MHPSWLESLLPRHAVPRHDDPMKDAWTLDELYGELEKFELSARAAGLAENSVRTYVDRSRFFVRWLAGDFQFRGPSR